MANFSAPMRGFTPKPIKSIKHRYHLSEIGRGLSLPDSPLRLCILESNLGALGLLESIAKPTAWQLRQLALESLSDHGLPIPKEIYIPEPALNEMKDGWESKPAPKPRQRRKESREEIESKIRRLQKKLESTLSDNSQKNQ